jgi:hypothetical protein
MRTLLFVAASLFAACGGKPELPFGAHVHADGTVHLPGEPEPAAKPAGDGHEHGTPHALGDVAIGDWKFAVTRFGDVVPGGESDFDLQFQKGVARPDALRVWVGLESAVGSMKTRFANEGDTVMHGHVLVPKVLPEGSRLWFAIEHKGQVQRGSLGWP